MRESKIIVDLSAVKYNYNKIKEYVNNKEVMPVIKAFGYGSFINTRVNFLNNFKIVGVALVEEGVFLRKLGYKNDIFILNQPFKSEVDLIIKYNLIVGVSSLEFLEYIKNKKIKIHLELETGMNRTGLNVNDIFKFINLIKKSNILLEGVYSHFSSADTNYDYTLKQFNIFKECVDIIKNYFNLKYIHISASSGILTLKEDYTNLVRVGLLLYGYYPNKKCQNIIDIKPSIKFISKISFIKQVEKDEFISYNQTYKTNRKSIIATVPVGYADGINMLLSNKGFVYINNKKCRIIGKICMDSLLVDVNDIDCKIDDEVVIFDNDNIKIDEICNITNLSIYNILSCISVRIDREFID